MHYFNSQVDNLDTYQMFRTMGVEEIFTLLHQNASRSHLPPLSLAFGNTDFSVQEYVDLGLLASEVEAVLSYGDIRGRIELRSKISSFYASNFGVDIPVERILITDGATGALVLALGLLVRPGSEVIVPNVGYTYYPRIIQAFGGIPIRAPLDAAFNLESSHIADLITAKTAAIVVNSPGNPHGNITSFETLAEIASLGIPVVFDEVYQFITFTGSFAPSAAQLPQEHFIVNGFSKSFAIPGLRMGFLIVPSRYAEVAESMMLLLHICTNRPAQLLAERLLERADVVLEAHQAYIHRNRDIFLAACSRHNLRLLTHPQAGFYGIINLPENIDSMTAARLLAKNYALATAPGTDFADFDPGFLRLNFARRAEDVEDAVQRIAQFLQDIAH